MSEEKLRRELEDAFRARAHVYHVMFDELSSELGPAKAEQIMVRALTRRGRDVAPALFAGRTGAVAVGEHFLSVSPDDGCLYPTEVEKRPHGISISVKSCPLKSAWMDAKLPPEMVATLCRIAGAFDRGLFEAAGVAFANETWREGRSGCCRIHLDDR